MNSRELSLPLRDCPSFLGVYGADDLFRLVFKIKRYIRTNTTPLLFVVNVHASSDSGMGHWVTFYVSASTLAFLDSFALPIATYGKPFTHFRSHLRHLRFLHLPYRVQSFQSLTCGAYALYLVSTICMNGLHGGLQRFFHLFKRGTYTDNDTKVLSYMYNSHHKRGIMPPCTPTFGYDDCKRISKSKQKKVQYRPYI